MQPLLHLYALDVTLGMLFCYIFNNTVTINYINTSFLEFITKHNQNFVDNMNVTYLNARVTFFTTLSKRMYSVFLQNDTVFRFSKYFKLRNEALSFMKKFTHDIIQSEELRRKEANRSGSRLHLIDVLFANNFDMCSLQNQIDSFVTAVSIASAMPGYV